MEFSVSFSKRLLSGSEDDESLEETVCLSPGNSSNVQIVGYDKVCVCQ